MSTSHAVMVGASPGHWEACPRSIKTAFSMVLNALGRQINSRTVRANSDFVI